MTDPKKRALKKKKRVTSKSEPLTALVRGLSLGGHEPLNSRAQTALDGPYGDTLTSVFEESPYNVGQGTADPLAGKNTLGLYDPEADKITLSYDVATPGLQPPSAIPNRTGMGHVLPHELSHRTQNTHYPDTRPDWFRDLDGELYMDHWRDSMPKDAYGSQSHDEYVPEVIGNAFEYIRQRGNVPITPDLSARLARIIGAREAYEKQIPGTMVGVRHLAGLPIFHNTPAAIEAREGPIQPVRPDMTQVDVSSLPGFRPEPFIPAQSPSLNELLLRHGVRTTPAPGSATQRVGARRGGAGQE